MVHIVAYRSVLQRIAISHLNQHCRRSNLSCTQHMRMLQPLRQQWLIDMVLGARSTRSRGLILLSSLQLPLLLRSSQTQDSCKAVIILRPLPFPASLLRRATPFAHSARDAGNIEKFSETRENLFAERAVEGSWLVLYLFPQLALRYVYIYIHV